MKTLLSIRNLITAFQTGNSLLTAVDGVSLDVPEGSCVGIVGESGCGKSVAAMSIVRLLPRPAGRILGGSIKFEGRDLVPLSSDEMNAVRGGRIGVIFQEPMTALNPVHTIGRQIAEPLMIHNGMSSGEALSAAEDILRRVRIPDPVRRLSEYPHQLSGGMRQRVVIAIALACNPRLIIADEPTTALDVTVQAQVLSLLRELREESGSACLLITHDMGVIAQQCDRVAVMYAGRIVELADVGELFSHPRHAYTQGLLRSIPSMSLPRKTRLFTIPGHVAPLDELVGGCRFCQRMGRAGETLHRRPLLTEISPGHWVEACPLCLLP